MYYVYMMRCSDNSLYSGITTDLERRFSEHTNKEGKGAKYTRAKEVVEIACAWVTDSGRSEASKLEAKLKKLTKEKKELCQAIIEAYKKGKKLGDASSYTRGLYYRGAQ